MDQTQAYDCQLWTTTNYIRNFIAQETQPNHQLKDRYNKMEKC